MADEIPNQNVIRVYRSPADGLWRAQIGPDDSRGVEQLGGTPGQALGRLVSRVHGGQYTFDPSWCPLPQTVNCDPLQPINVLEVTINGVEHRYVTADRPKCASPCNAQ